MNGWITCCPGGGGMPGGGGRCCCCCIQGGGGIPGGIPAGRAPGGGAPHGGAAAPPCTPHGSCLGTFGIIMDALNQTLPANADLERCG